MKTPRPVLAQVRLTPDQLREGMDELAVPRITAPSSPAATGQGDAAAKESRSRPTQTKATPRDKMKRVTFEVPDYLFDALRDKAHAERCSIRSVVMKALRIADFRVEDADMQDDARRNNGKRKG
jgi:hypothetical protein